MTRSISRENRVSQNNLLEWLLIFVALLAAAIVISQVNLGNAEGLQPQVILVILLYVFVANFSIPVGNQYVGLTPIVGLSSLLILGLPSTLFAAAIGLPLAEIIRPVWIPLWESLRVQTPSWPYRFGTIVISIVNLMLAGALAEGFNDEPSLIERSIASIPNTTVNTLSPIVLTTVFVLIYVLLTIGFWALLRMPIVSLFNEASGTLLGTIFFAAPLTLFVANSNAGLPGFVFLCIGIAAFAVIAWTSWRRRYQVVRRLDQFGVLNAVGSNLRETLELPQVIALTYEKLDSLIEYDDACLILRNSDGVWEEPTRASSHRAISFRTMKKPPNDLVKWVVERNKVLDLDSGNLHFAQERKMRLPNPMPKVWFGIPLNAGDRTIGALVLEKTRDDQPFTLWNREVVFAIAGQASAAVENARLYEETLRLYNMTDVALAQRVEELQALLFSIEEGVLMVGADDGKIDLVNPTAASMLGNKVEELRGSELGMVSAETIGYQPTQLTTLISTLKEKNTPTPSEFIYELALEGTRRIIEREETPVTAEDGDLIGWLMVFRDITEETERAEWRADLTRMIVHDLRNPITTISSSMSLMENRIEKQNPEPMTDLISTAKHNCNNMLEMVDSLLDINRAEAGKFEVDAEAMRLPPLANDVINVTMPLAVQREIGLIFEYEENLPAVWADAEVVRRIMVNLLDNALKFTPAGGSVRGVMTHIPATKTHEAGVQVSVYDSGPGIPADQKERIFDRFITFNRGGGQDRGTGLGLTFCKLGIEAHEGKIWVEDNPSGGSIFSFTLPGIPHF